jgi:predicted transcriptional regulator
MSTVKQEVQNLLSDLPDTSTLEEIQYHLYAIAKIRNGIAAAEQLGVVSQDEVEGEILQWLSSK